MKIAIDKKKCAGHSRCYSGYPELFGMDEYGESCVLNDGVVPEALEEDAEYAIGDCPEQAIVIVSKADR